MTEISISNIDETLRSIRSERADIERKTKIRDEEYKRATKQYIKSLHKETEAFNKNRFNYDQRNESFKEEVNGVIERFKVGAFGLLKSRNRLNKEIEKLNHNLLDHYPKLATEVKESLLKEREEIENQLLRAKEENKKQGPVKDFHLQVPSAHLLDIREKRQELDRSVRPSYGGDFALLRDIQANHISLEHRRSPLRNQSHLEEFSYKAAAPAFVEIIPVKPTTKLIDPVTTTNYVIEKEIEVSKGFIQPQTDFLSEFYYKVPNVIYSPSKVREGSPAKSESLLYSPFSGAGIETESRVSRHSSMKKGIK